MWLVTIIVLALIAFFTMKVLKAQSLRKVAEKEREMQRSGLEGSLNSTDSTGAGLPPSPTDHNHTENQSTAAGSSSSASAQLNSGDSLHDIREMIKILNLAEPDAGRLALSREEFSAIRHGSTDAKHSEETLSNVAARLRNMLA